MPPHCFCVISLLHYYDVSPDEYTAVLQGAGGQWDVTCSAPSESSGFYITAMTWETADGRELSRSPHSNSVVYSAPVEATLEMICYTYTFHPSVQFLQFFVLIAQGKYMIMDLQRHLCRCFDADMHSPCVVTAWFILYLCHDTCRWFQSHKNGSSFSLERSVVLGMIGLHLVLFHTSLMIHANCCTNKLLSRSHYIEMADIIRKQVAWPYSCLHNLP